MNKTISRAEVVALEGNQGQATIEIFKDNKQIWSNEK